MPLPNSLLKGVEVVLQLGEYVGLAKVKKAAAPAEEQPQRIRHENLAASNRLPSKSLETGILELDNLTALTNDLSSQPISMMLEQIHLLQKLEGWIYQDP